MSVTFRSVEGRPLEPLLGRLLDEEVFRGRRVLVLLEGVERLRALDAALWTFDPASFVPHGTAGDGLDGEHPVLLATEVTRVNGADVAVILEDAMPSALPVEGIEAWHYVFDAREPWARERGRERWRALSADGHELTFLEAGPDGWQPRGRRR